jgi:hypothetical protein
VSDRNEDNEMWRAVHSEQQQRNHERKLAALARRDLGFDDDDVRRLMPMLAVLPHLTWLDLSGNNIGDAGAAALAALTSLTWLILDGCVFVTDIAPVAALTSLRRLSLTDCVGLTDAGLVHVATLTSLEWLFLDGCVGVTDAGMAALRAALPGCTIYT